ncbi:MAG: ABC transporter substrate-binding protein [Pseudomonadota bacterium]
MRLAGVLILGLFSLSGWGQGSTAHDVVRATTDQIMASVEEARGYVDEDPERYYSSVLEILDPVVDFRGFARGVMGPYATSERYRSLDENGRAQLRGQLDEFTGVMRLGLVRTYSKGILAFAGSRIELTDPSDEDAGQSRVSVKQLIYGEQTEPYVMMYQMGRDKSGEWKLRNMIIESVNLGEIYRSQFQSAARKYDGDLDEVIANWTAVEIEEPGDEPG